MTPEHALAEAGRDFYQRGWVLGTSGNFSSLIDSHPLRLLITSSGKSKGHLGAEDFVVVDDNSSLVAGQGKPSAETSLHIEILRQRPAASVLHTHSVWSTILSQLAYPAGYLEISGYEMLKGLSGVTTHQHIERLPILDNSQDYPSLTAQLSATLQQYPAAHGVLFRRHGLYTWGSDIAEARRHVEILEFLLEAVGRELSLSHDPHAR
ncbi:MAG: methylthioribulose 1-phosphate dehydratase [Acidobacteria bacterium]|nr:methylthioribulose 1-phosphate dehydratase [Acidobacteriota bacterium]